MSDRYQPGELFVYTNGDRWELGMVKRPNGRGDGYFCWYSRGDTAANTPTSCMHKLSNAGFTHIEQMMDDEKPLNVPNEITVLIELFCKDYAQCLVDSTAYGKHNRERIDRRALEKAEGVEAKLIRELAEDIAKVGAPTCTMEPDGYYGEQYGIYKCSNCGELWQFVCDGPKENHWTCCPRCQARIKEEAE